MLHVESGAVILNIEGRFPLLLDPAEFDPWFLHASGVFPGVSQEISQRHPQQLSVTLAGQRFRDDDDHLALRFSHRQLLYNIPRHGGEIEGLTVKLLTNDVGQDQDRLDQLLHPLTSLADVVEEHAPGFIEVVAIALHKQIGGHIGASKRCPQVMGKGIAE